ncbi:MAG: M28 family peptidase [Candidatus Methanofastidiosia archaeon]|jgi:endoglucanase
MKNLFHHLETLVDIPGPVGRESLVQTYIEDNMTQYTTDIEYDRVGNLIAHFPSDGPRTVVAAHACEIGFVVKHITGQGYLEIAPNYKTRAPDTRILPFHDVTVLTDTYKKIEGVLTTDTGHVVEKEARKKAPDLIDILVDIGVNSESEAATQGICVGCPVIWDARYKPLGTRIKGKALDDRLGLALLLELAAYLSEHTVNRDLYIASTVQEEIGVRGAHALASGYTFEESYILEITPTSRSGPLELGSGPAIVYKDSSLHYNHPLIVKCKNTARKHDIPLQPAILERGITDGLGFFVNSASKPVLLGCPTLYPHSPGETIDKRDLQHLSLLLRYILS